LLGRVGGGVKDEALGGGGVEDPNIQEVEDSAAADSVDLAMARGFLPLVVRHSYS